MSYSLGILMAYILSKPLFLKINKKEIRIVKKKEQMVIYIIHPPSWPTWRQYLHMVSIFEYVDITTSLFRIVWVLSFMA